MVAAWDLNTFLRDAAEAGVRDDEHEVVGRGPEAREGGLLLVPRTAAAGWSGSDRP